MYGQDVCALPLPYGHQPLPSKASDDTRGAGEGNSKFGNGESERRAVMTKFEVISVKGGYIIQYWEPERSKMKVEVVPDAGELRERIDFLIPSMEEE